MSQKSSSRAKRARSQSISASATDSSSATKTSSRLRQAATMDPKLPRWPYVGDIRKEFRILQKLGSGAGGTVHVVRRRSDNAVFALKVIHSPSEWTNTEWLALERLRESTDCGASGVVCHRGHFIIDRLTSDSSVHPRLPALLMDYVDGPDLHEFARAWWEEHDRAPDQRLARSLAVSCLAALATVHSAGLAHRDIKPENIVVQTKGPNEVHCTIVDFAYACDEDTCGSVRFSGTPCYATSSRLDDALLAKGDARQCLSALQREQAGDVWALGLALFFFLTGSEPWPCIVSDAIQDAETPLPTAIAALARFTERYRLLDHERVAGDDRQLESVLSQMLEPEDRMRLTAAAALAALQ